MTPTVPTPPQHRVLAIDALRGAALLGVLIVNAETEFRVSIFQNFLPPVASDSALNRFVEAAVWVGVESKAFSIFSFLFGVGLAIQFERFSTRGRPFALLARRLAILAIFGAIHILAIWNGDILLEYAIAGFVVLPLLLLPQAAMLAASLASIVIYLTLPALLVADVFPSQAWITQHVRDAQMLAHASYSQIRAFEIAELRQLLLLHVSVFARTVALMTFGVYAWRTRIFERTRTPNTFTVFAVIGLCLWAGTVSSAPALAPVGLAAFYVSLFLMLIGTSVGRAAFGWLAPIGRMAFSNYIMQSLVLGLTFYGIGLGLRESFGPATTLLFCIGLFVVQAVASALWLRRFHFGPLEWLWRTLTYGRSMKADIITSSSGA